MKLFKSIFWLSIAYLAVGPQVNAVESINDISRQTLSGGSEIITSRLDQIECDDLACMGGKLAVTSTLNMLPRLPQREATVSAFPENIPFPRPRLERS